MRQIIARLAIIILLLPAAALARNSKTSDTLIIGMPDWCPHTCSDPDRPGIMVEITKAILDARHIKYEFRLYDNWKRLLYDGRKGKRIDAVLAIAPTEEPSLIYPAEMMTDAVISFFIRADDDWKFESVRSFEDKVIIVYDNVDYGSNIQPYIDEYKNDRTRVELATGETEEVLIKRMAAGHGDIYLEDHQVGLYMMLHEKLGDKVKEIPNTLDEHIPMGIAFSPNFRKADAFTHIIDEGIKQLREDGTIEAIQRRYSEQPSP